MKTILGIEIPDLASLSSDDLKALAEKVRLAGIEAGTGEVDADKLAEIKLASAFVIEARAELTTRTEASAALAAERDAALAALADEGDEDAEKAAADAKAAEDAEAAEAEAAAAAEAEAKEAEDAEAAAAAAKGPAFKATAAAVAASGGQSAADAAAAAAAALAATTPKSTMKFVGGVTGRQGGDDVENMGDLADALVSRWGDIAGGGSEKLSVATLRANFTPAQTLSEDVAANIAKFGGVDPLAPSAELAITAAMCAPAEPLYDMAFMSSVERPVKGSMATYVPARGAVTVYPTPHLADISGGTGIWTRADDADSNAVKAACATIPCASPVQYDIYGVYRCMTVKNLLQMTFPELVAAFLNRLQAIQSRLGEVTLLDAMIGSVNTKEVTVAGTDFDASIDLWTTIENVVAVYREEERFGSQRFDAWMPRWVRSAVKIGLMRQRRTQGSLADRIPTDADVDAALRNLGVDVTWTLDVASVWEPVHAQADGQPLVELPTTAPLFLAPKGNLRVLDRGDLAIGVTNNNIYRDNASNTKNQFTMFYETFEGLMDFGATNWHVNIAGFKPSGAQTGDVTAITLPDAS